uniref:Uncharacterized protein n=1 Tax=Glossina brevipalpis TaxID=37001 RepID=A0A1A9W2W9_9MUSC
MQRNIKKFTSKATKVIRKSISSPHLSQLSSLGRLLRINPRYPIKVETGVRSHQHDCKMSYTYRKTLEFCYKERSVMISESLNSIFDSTGRSSISNVSHNDTEKTNLYSGEMLSRLGDEPEQNPLLVLKSPIHLKTSSILQFADNDYDPCQGPLGNKISSQKDYKPYNTYSNPDDAARIYRQTNEAFSERLLFIDNNGLGYERKLDVLEKWIDVLLKVNYVVINNMKGLETAVGSCIERFQPKHIDSLTTVVYRNESWDSRVLSLVNIPPSESVDISNSSIETLLPEQEFETKKQFVNNDLEEQLERYEKSLAIVAKEKQDRVNELKEQIASQQKEMQEKIKNKDEMIEKLQNERKNVCIKVFRSNVHAFLITILNFINGKF